jgi:hypothetical protein
MGWGWKGLVLCGIVFVDGAWVLMVGLLMWMYSGESMMEFMYSSPVMTESGVSNVRRTGLVTERKFEMAYM